MPAFGIPGLYFEPREPDMPPPPLHNPFEFFRAQIDLEIARINANVHIHIANAQVEIARINAKASSSDKRGISNVKLKLNSSVKIVLYRLNIKTRDDLDEYCKNNTREKFYGLVYEITDKTQWNSIKYPKSYIRYTYQTILSGFKISSI